MATKLEEIQRRLEEIEARAAKATPGPWRWIPHKGDPYWRYELQGASRHVGVWPEDADFIAACREDNPWLCQVVREFLAQYAAMREPLEWLASIEECGNGFVVGDPVNEEHAKHCPECQAILAARKALQFEAGREFLDRLDKLERVAEVAREIAEHEPYLRDYALSGSSDPRVCFYCEAPCGHEASDHKSACPLRKLQEALAALEEVE